MAEEIRKRINVVFVAGGVWHDIDFARLEVLKLLAEDERIRTRVFENYDAAVPALANADFVISYTCNVVGGVDTQEAFRNFVKGGKRWFALHGTNSVLRFVQAPGGKPGETVVDSPRWAPLMMQTLGSQFVAHPPIAPYRVDVTRPDHPMVAGIEPFTATDEQYLVETYGELDVLLHTDFEGEAEGFIEHSWEKSRHPVLYFNAVGDGHVLYLTLGHCRGHYDMTDFTPFYPKPERGAWQLELFYTLLRRGIAWAREPALKTG